VAEIQERAFEFALRVVSLAEHMMRRGGVPRSLSYQLLHSGTSIGANLAEASAGQSRADFVTKCSVAAKEARETLYWLRLVRHAGLVAEKRLTAIIDEAAQLVAILTQIVKTASSRHAASKTKEKARAQSVH
jgi:four helix bundle protein